MNRTAVIFVCVVLLLVPFAIGCSAEMASVGSDKDMVDVGPAWSPDGSRIAFTSWALDMEHFVSEPPDSPDPSGCYVMDADGRNRRQVTSGGRVMCWTPDGTGLVISIGDGIATVDLDGEDLTYLVTPGDLPDGAFPLVWGSFSPDGSRIVFSASVGCAGYYARQIFVAGADGSNPARVGRPEVGGDWPRWSPDGSRILFHSESLNPLGADIYVMNADGTGVVRLTDRPEDERSAEWSPDGHRIAFISNDDSEDDDRAEVFVMNADGSDVTRLTHNYISEMSLSWSPDGKRLAVEGRRSGKHLWHYNRIYLCDAA